MTEEKICYRDGKKCEFKESDNYDCVDCERQYDKKREPKVKWSDISIDFKIVCRLYEFTENRKEQVLFTRLVDSFVGELSRSEISKSLDKMYDLGMINGEYQKTPDKMYSYCYFLEDEVDDFAKTIFENTQEKPLC
jgi:hypothetical protein